MTFSIAVRFDGGPHALRAADDFSRPPSLPHLNARSIRLLRIGISIPYSHHIEINMRELLPSSETVARVVDAPSVQNCRCVRLLRSIRRR